MLSISIHALREEGDSSCFTSSLDCSYFYPRPPRGGRLLKPYIMSFKIRFLSTPSARRATHTSFYPAQSRKISIHALREEGDPAKNRLPGRPLDFYPRPPRGGRHARIPRGGHTQNFYPRPPRGGRLVPEFQRGYMWDISIHALREEGDRYPLSMMTIERYFYPRPPRGGRLVPALTGTSAKQFLSTPSARRATACSCAGCRRHPYFYPRPPRGGRRVSEDEFLPLVDDFYPRPPRGGRQHRRPSFPPAFNFYPRPPRGGRQVENRARQRDRDFYPRPPRGGRRIC